MNELASRELGHASLNNLSERVQAANGNGLKAARRPREFWMSDVRESSWD